MKVLAIATIIKPVTPEQRQEIMPKEVPATLKLYLDGKIEQFWARRDAPGVIFLLNAASVDEAKATIEALPLSDRRLREIRGTSRSVRSRRSAC